MSDSAASIAAISAGSSCAPWQLYLVAFSQFKRNTCHRARQI
jgi:hypothetical protein